MDKIYESLRIKPMTLETTLLAIWLEWMEDWASLRKSLENVLSPHCSSISKKIYESLRMNLIMTMETTLLTIWLAWPFFMRDANLSFNLHVFLDSMNFDKIWISGMSGNTMFLKVQGYPVGSAGFQSFPRFDNFKESRDF